MATIPTPTFAEARRDTQPRCSSPGCGALLLGTGPGGERAVLRFGVIRRHVLQQLPGGASGGRTGRCGRDEPGVRRPCLGRGAASGRDGARPRIRRGAGLLSSGAGGGVAGARQAVADIVTRGPILSELRKLVDSWAACVAGALTVEAYIRGLTEAGFEDVRARPADGREEEQTAEGLPFSALIAARKPV